jgi:hypothetical protein
MVSTCFGNLTEPTLPVTIRIGDVVTDENSHRDSLPCSLVIKDRAALHAWLALTTTETQTEDSHRDHLAEP